MRPGPGPQRITGTLARTRALLLDEPDEFWRNSPSQRETRALDTSGGRSGSDAGGCPGRAT